MYLSLASKYLIKGKLGSHLLPKLYTKISKQRAKLENLSLVQLW